MLIVHCIRANREISESECCQTILDTTDRKDLLVCRECPQGIKLAALCPYQERFMRNDAIKILPKLLARVFRRYPAFRTHSFTFLASVAFADFSCNCTPYDLYFSALNNGLTIVRKSGKDMLVVDQASKEFVKSYTEKEKD